MTLKDKKMDISITTGDTQAGTLAHTLRFVLWGWESAELRAIMLGHLPKWAELFARKNSEYGSGAAFDLGERGQFSDMYRKMIKLRRALWDGEEDALTTEPVEEILMDLIGHCFLTLEMRARNSPNQEAPVPWTVGKVFEMPDPFDLAEQAIKEVNGGYTSESYEVGGMGVQWLSSGDIVEFRQHLRRGGSYEIMGFDTTQPDGMVCQMRPLVDKGEIAIPFWTNPDWLVLRLADEDEKMNMATEQEGRNEVEEYISVWHEGGTTYALTGENAGRWVEGYPTHELVRIDKNCPVKLTVSHIRETEPEHAERYHFGEAIVW